MSDGISYYPAIIIKEEGDVSGQWSPLRVGVEEDLVISSELSSLGGEDILPQMGFKCCLV